MRLLCLDTSTEMLCIGLQAENNIFTYQEKVARKQSEYILPVIQDLLSQANIALQDLNAIAFGQGPGSFMGVRLACSVAQGLAFGSHLPVISVSSLQIIAQSMADQKNIDAVMAGIDARMGEIYWGLFQRDSASLMQCNGEEKLSKNLSITDFYYPDVQAFLKLAKAKYQKNEMISAMEAQPVYLRNQVTSQ